MKYKSPNTTAQHQTEELISASLLSGFPVTATVTNAELLLLSEELERAASVVSGPIGDREYSGWRGDERWGVRVLLEGGAK